MCAVCQGSGVGLHERERSGSGAARWGKEWWWGWMVGSTVEGWVEELTFPALCTPPRRRAVVDRANRAAGRT